MSIIWNVFLLSIAIFFVAKIVPGIRYKNVGTIVVVAVLYSILNFFLFGILTFVTWPLIWVTFGLFTLVINTFLLWLTDKLIDDFEIDGIGTTLVTAALVSMLSGLLKWIF